MSAYPTILNNPEFPTITRLELGDLARTPAISQGSDWREFDAIALPLLAAPSDLTSGKSLKAATVQTTPPSIPSLAILKLLESEGNFLFSEVIAQWPDRTGKAGEIIEIPITIPGTSLARIYLVGVGESGVDDFRKAGIALARKCKASGKSILDLTLAAKAESGALVAHLTAIILASYSWQMKSVKSVKGEKKRVPTCFAIVTSANDEFDRAMTLATAVWRARDLIHTPANIKTPAWMADQAKKLVAASKSPALSVEVLSGSALKKFGGLTAVGHSSPNPGPRFITVTYSPKSSKKVPHIVLVGKGITFDTGGISLKRPYDYMIGMKSDMAGSAAVLATVVAAAEIGAQVKVTALMMCAENAISSTAQRPSDVITQYGGTTVEIINTDAEGRLVLADGLAYADLELDPDYIIDIATLTGAATLALGRSYGAMYTRDQKLAAQFEEIGARIGEKVWHMPLVDDYAIAMESDVADLNHDAHKPDFSGGSVTAALFLENFVQKKSSAKWVHFDIAGPARSEADSGENPKGGTGFGVRLLTEWIANFR